MNKEQMRNIRLQDLYGLNDFVCSEAGLSNMIDCIIADGHKNTAMLVKEQLNKTNKEYYLTR